MSRITLKQMSPEEMSMIKGGEWIVEDGELVWYEHYECKNYEDIAPTSYI